MTTTTFLLDLTRGWAGAGDTLSACREMTSDDWRILAMYSDADGEETARLLARHDLRLSAFEAGSGTGDCDWEAAIRSVGSTFVVFVRPGDRPHVDALERWHREIERQQRPWVLGAAPGAPYNDWWFQRDLAESGAALLATGAAFPECTALVRRDAWLQAIERLAASRTDPSRAAAWFALASMFRPALLPEVVATTPHLPGQMSADTLADVLAGLAARDAESAGQLIADASRLAAGMRIGMDALLDALRSAECCFGRAPSVHNVERDWRTRVRFFEALLCRGERAIWIWGAGQMGLVAQRWLDARRIPIAGFLDKNAQRDGTEWGGLRVRHAGGLLGARDRDHGHTSNGEAPDALVVIASMYHAEIAADLSARGWCEGCDFVIFQDEVRLDQTGDLAS